MKKLGFILLVTVLALVLVGCGVYGVSNVSGRGTVQLSGGEINGGPLVPGIATFSLNFACYAQNNNRLEGSLTWNDPTNGVRISAMLPETSVREFTNGEFTTCKALKAASANAEFSVNLAGIYSQNGNADGDAGTITGMAIIVVSKPGVGDCGPTGTEIDVVQMTTESIDPIYEAWGCLDRGKITWGGTQNQQ